MLVKSTTCGLVVEVDCIYFRFSASPVLLSGVCGLPTAKMILRRLADGSGRIIL
jgi:hypothetical protein